MRLFSIRAALLLGICLTSQFASASLSIVLGWDPSPDIEIAGYRLHIGTQPGVFTRTIDVGPATQAVASELEWDTLYYFAVSAYNASSLESELSEPIAYRTPQAPIVTIEPPIIQQQPIDQLVAKGSNTTITARWTGSSPLICQWYKGDMPLSEGVHYQGVNSSNLTILNTDASDEGLYYVALSNPSGTAKSEMAYVHVIIGPKIESVVSLDNGTFRVTIVNQDGSPLAPTQVYRVTVLASTNPAPQSTWLPLTNWMDLNNGVLHVKDIHLLNYPQRYYRTRVTDSSIGPLHLEQPKRQEDGLIQISIKRENGLPLSNNDVFNYQVFVRTNSLSDSQWALLSYPMSYSNGVLTIDDTNTTTTTFRAYRVFVK